MNISSDHGIVNESVTVGKMLKNGTSMGEKIGVFEDGGNGEEMGNGKWGLGDVGCEEVSMDLFELLQRFAFLQ